MFLVRKIDSEVRNKALRFVSCQELLTYAWEWITESVARRGLNMAVATDVWNWSLARKELRPVTTETTLMFGILRYVRKAFVTFPNFFPILGGKLVACLAFALMRLREMRELTIVNARGFPCGSGSLLGNSERARMGYLSSLNIHGFRQ